MAEFGLWRDYPLHILFVMATEQEYEHWSEYLGIVDRRLAIEVDRLFAAIKSGAFTL
jgi:hypothetical protein